MDKMNNEEIVNPTKRNKQSIPSKENNEKLTAISDNENKLYMDMKTANENLSKTRDISSHENFTKIKEKFTDEKKINNADIY